MNCLAKKAYIRYVREVTDLAGHNKLYRRQAISAFEVDNATRKAEARRRHEELVTAISRPRQESEYSHYRGYNYGY